MHHSLSAHESNKEKEVNVKFGYAATLLCKCFELSSFVVCSARVCLRFHILPILCCCVSACAFFLLKNINRRVLLSLSICPYVCDDRISACDFIFLHFYCLGAKEKKLCWFTCKMDETVDLLFVPLSVAVVAAAAAFFVMYFIIFRFWVFFF